ncbi:MAG TPA: peptidylprolyl isomerase [Myxococcota bacterium]|nr:peptidylprolyl isomerase [Myxococcota bacterium]
MRPFLARLLRSPLGHFLLLGGLLLIAQQRFEGATRPEPRPRIVLDAARRIELERDFATRTGRAPTETERARLLAAAIDEEILYREAVARGWLERDGGVQTRLIQKMRFLEDGTDPSDEAALLARAVDLGLHRDDLVVRRILVEKMRLSGSALDAGEAPTSAEVEAAYAAQHERLRSPDRRTLAHVFLSADRRPGRAREDATALHARLVAEAIDPTAAVALGDPFPLGHRLTRRARADLDRELGAGFGRQVFAAAPGRWSEPIASAYGWHLVQVEAVEAGETPPLAIVAEKLRRDLAQARRERKLTSLLAELRARYEVVVPDEPAGPQETG